MDLRRLRLARLPEAATFHTSYVRSRWPALFNASGFGNARFSPLQTEGAPVPMMYGATTQTVALLETSFHDVHEMGTRIVSESLNLAPRGLVALTTPASLPLIDLTDEGLARVGLSRAQLVATTAAHYACTREWAVVLHARRIGPVVPVGLLWRSRVAELAQSDSLLLGDLLTIAGHVFVLFGDRLSTDPGAWQPGDPHFDDLLTGNGRLLAEQIAEQLGAVMVPS
ncbi:MAG: RES family NAD+ phosphorylase [Actinomycetota bacterium]|nr:RES family NAD+ phosphorylase [Actinomycetota bacterium]